MLKFWLVLVSALMPIMVTRQEETSTSANTMAQFMQDVFYTHNRLRAKHGVEPLKINIDLVRMAQAEAENYAQNISALNKTQYNNESIGENFAFSQGSSLTGKDVTELWYSRGENFNYTLDSIQDAAAFTQLIWKSSREIGVGLAHRDENYFVVCFYYPAGNTDDILENVLPPKD